MDVLQKKARMVELKCMDYEVESVRPRGRSKKIRTKVVKKDCQARQLNENAMDCSK